MLMFVNYGGKIKLNKISEVNPYVFNDALIISLSSEWIEVFEKIPKFSVLIEKGRLILQSEECSNLKRKVK